jgi:RNA polymerase sigma-70 factor, ECF subfamily
MMLDEPTFDRAYRAYAKRLRAVAFRVLQDRDAAEDAVHNALMRVWSARSYRPERGVLLPFLIACVRREAMDSRRASQRRHEREMRATSGELLAIDDMAAIDPVEARWVRRALDTLRPEHRGVIELAYYHNHTLAEIAREESLPLGTVKSRLSAALRLLHAALTADERNAPSFTDPNDSAAAYSLRCTVLGDPL